MSKVMEIPQELREKMELKLRQTFVASLQTEGHKALAEVKRLRRVHPKMKPQQMISFLGKQYLLAVSLTGAGAGGTAVIPNGPAPIAAAIADLAIQLERSVSYALKVAAIKGMHTEDVERRRLLVMSAFLGEAAAKSFLSKYSPKIAGHLGKQIVALIPRSAIKEINKVLGPRFITVAGTKAGALVLSKQVPFLIGAFLGATGNSIFGYMLIKSVKKITGPVPKSWKKFDEKTQQQLPSAE